MRGRIGAVAAVVAVTATTAACSSGPTARWSGHGGSTPKQSGVAVAVTPADRAVDVPVSAEISAKPGAGVHVTGVALSEAGKDVRGAMRPDGSSWVPDEPLDFTTTYTVKVSATDPKGKRATKTTTFTTMASPGNRVGAHLYLTDGATYGQAMPIVFEFRGYSVREPDRAAVERRLFVASNPPQIGAWHWFGGSHLEYRPKEYWQPGTKVVLRLGLGGLPLGGGHYGQYDITSNFVADSHRREIKVVNATKSLTAYDNGVAVKTMPVSLGKPAHPSFYGTMVVMEKLAKTVFDSSTYGVPASSPGGYKTNVNWAQRLTWDGQFIHGAPWSVAQQGHVNVSHGCVNVSDPNAAWLFTFTKVGDPVVVTGTELPLKPGNGFTAWNLTWEEFLAGSALPPPTAPAPAPTSTG